MQYDGSVANLYLNGVLACSQNFKPVNCGDANLQNTNYSNGTTFLGYLRNLTVYSTPVAPLVAKYTLGKLRQAIKRTIELSQSVLFYFPYRPKLKVINLSHLSVANLLKSVNLAICLSQNNVKTFVILLCQM